MHANATLPQLTSARVLTPGGPYRTGSVLSVAFVDPLVGRLAPHESGRQRDAANDCAIVPETISVVLLDEAPPYASGETLALSFVDPAIARIHRWPKTTVPTEAIPAHAAPGAVAPAPPPPGTPVRMSEGPAPEATPVGLRLEWTVARVGRLLSLSEKLLSIDRLGWYRHALAMRLLLPDEIVVADAEASETAARQLRALKIAATEALGTPLLSALMPSFTLDEEWLRSIETPALARAAAALRETLTRHAAAPGQRFAALGGATHLSIGTLERDDIERAGAGGLDAFLAALIPSEGATPALAACLGTYKATLIELFGQTAQSSAAVRTTRLATPNPVLDERLAAVAREIDRAFGRLAVA